MSHAVYETPDDALASNTKRKPNQNEQSNQSVDTEILNKSHLPQEDVDSDSDSLGDEEFHRKWEHNWEDDYSSSDGSSYADSDSESISDSELEELTEHPDESRIQRLAKRKLGDAYQVIETYCSSWEYSLLDIAAFVMYLAAFNKREKSRISEINDYEFVLDAYHYAQYAFAAYKGPSIKRVMKRLPFLPQDDFIIGNWDKEELLNIPAWYIVLDRDKKNVILSLRGTKGREDILVDLTCQNIPWLGGYAHQGFVRSVEGLRGYVEDAITDLMKHNPGYELRIVGHSLGAGVGALLTLLWAREHPEWNVRGFGFATPCVISAHLIEESKKTFTTYVHHFDAITRLSMGSIDDIRNGMAMFSKQAAKSHGSAKIFLSSVAKLANLRSGEKMLEIVGAIDENIQESLDLEMQKMEVVTHLFPSGDVFQLWRDKRKNHFTKWDLYHSTSGLYGRLQMTRSMLKDHGSAGYNRALENLLTISVVERSVWLSLKPSLRSEVKNYWDHSVEEIPLFGDQRTVDVSKSVELMKQVSKYKRKAFKYGVIRPFLLMVSMTPRRRAALAKLIGIKLTEKSWYLECNPHREAWCILRSRAKGIQSRSNDSGRTLNPFAHNSNWYQILYMCQKVVRKQIGYTLTPELNLMLHGIKKSYGDSIAFCQQPQSKVVPRLEEAIVYMFFEMAKSETPEAQIPFKHDEQEINRVRHQMKNLGFSVDEFLDTVSKYVVEQSLPKTANELYAWSDVIRREEERLKKRTVAGVVGLTALGGFLFLTSIPMLMVTPPVALVPIAAGIGVGTMAATRAKPSGLVSIVVGCLQQRLALASQGIRIEDYYSLRNN